MTELRALPQPKRATIDRLVEAIRTELEERSKQSPVLPRMQDLELLLQHPELLRERILDLPIYCSDEVHSPRAWTTIKVGGHDNNASKKAFISAIRDAGLDDGLKPEQPRLHDEFADFDPMSCVETEVGLVGLSGEDIGFMGPVSFYDVAKRAKLLGFEPAPPEAPFQMALQQREFVIAHGKKLTFAVDFLWLMAVENTFYWVMSPKPHYAHAHQGRRLATLLTKKESHGFRLRLSFDKVSQDRPTSEKRVYIFAMPGTTYPQPEQVDRY